MAARCARLLLAGCLLAGMGAHWVALQAYGWAAMLASRARAQGLAAAVATTFDGEHPCGVCLLVEEGTRSSEEQAPRAAYPKAHFIHDAPPRLPTALCACELPSAPVVPALAAVPPLDPPPPRA